MYQNKLYIADQSAAEWFDPAANSWTSWPPYKTTVRFGSCMVLWRNFFLLIDYFNLQTFDLTANTWTTRCQFHQRITYNFYAWRSQKHKKYSLVISIFFTLSGSASVKAVRKTLMKSSPGLFALHKQLSFQLALRWQMEKFWLLEPLASQSYMIHPLICGQNFRQLTTLKEESALSNGLLVSAYSCLEVVELPLLPKSSTRY